MICKKPNGYKWAKATWQGVWGEDPRNLIFLTSNSQTEKNRGHKQWFSTTLSLICQQKTTFHRAK